MFMTITLFNLKCMSNVDTDEVHQVLASHLVTPLSLSTKNRNKARYEIGVISQQMADSKHFFTRRFLITQFTQFSAGGRLCFCVVVTVLLQHVYDLNGCIWDSGAWKRKKNFLIFLHPL